MALKPKRSINMQRSESFLRAVQDLKRALPSLRKSLSSHFEVQAEESLMFRAVFESCFEALASHFREEYKRRDQFGIFEHLGGLEPNFTREQLSTFLVQHFLLEPLLGWMFPEALAQNRISQQVEGVMQVFENRAWLRMSVDGYFSLIERELRISSSSAERQHVFNTVCEQFLNGFDPQRAEELGVIYTPPEIVEFMCSSCEEQIRQAYGRSLSSTSVPILDPCTGTGSFLVNVIGRIDLVALPYKYANELFGVEIMLLPYYLATLNVEQAFFERSGRYQPFPGMRYADALLA
jgi:predicted helicase